MYKLIVNFVSRSILWSEEN